MKRFFRFCLFLTLIAFVMQLNAQVETVLENAVPEFYGDLKITPDKKYDKTKKTAYRTLYFKLDDILSEIKAIEIDAATAEVVKILDYKELKRLQRNDSLNRLKQLVQENMKTINDFMKWDERFAADSINIALYYTGYKDALKNKDYKKADKNWRILFNNYPLISSSIYTGGAKLVKRKIKATKDSLQRRAYIDTLFMVYDQQVKVYPQLNSLIKGKKSLDYFNYFVKNQNLNDSIVRTQINTNYLMCVDAINSGGKKTKYYVFPIAMTLSIFQQQLDSISELQAIDNYMKYSELLQNQHELEKDKKKKDKIQNGGIAQIDNIFAKSDISTCKNLTHTFRIKFEKNPDNATNLKKILTILSKKDCVTDPLYGEVAEALYKVEPSANSAHSLAMLYASQEKYEKASDYFQKAIDQEKVPATKAQYYFEAAKLYNAQNKYGKAREYARNSLEIDPNKGEPYILIATLYASTASSVGDDAFAHAAVFWAAVDKLKKARSVDPSCTENANKLISTYSSRFPKREEGFMQGFTEGKAYTVGGWIGETTTARYLK